MPNYLILLISKYFPLFQYIRNFFIILPIIAILPVSYLVLRMQFWVHSKTAIPCELNYISLQVVFPKLTCVQKDDGREESRENDLFFPICFKCTQGNRSLWCLPLARDPSCIIGILKKQVLYLPHNPLLCTKPLMLFLPQLYFLILVFLTRQTLQTIMYWVHKLVPSNGNIITFKLSMFYSHQAAGTFPPQKNL